MLTREMQPEFEELDHTADLAMRVRGATLDLLFRHAAGGMMQLMTGPLPGISAQTERTVDIGAEALDALLRDWLSELIFLVAAERLVPVSFVLERIDAHGLRARVGVVPLTDTIARDATEIKAVTWHGLRVDRDEEGFVAEVVFDT
ncbi:MAG: archease [Bacteroidetes bacterium]|nr:archease [Bacteroidota bacterium]